MKCNCAIALRLSRIEHKVKITVRGGINNAIQLSVIKQLHFGRHV